MSTLPENLSPHLWLVGPAGLVVPERVVAVGRWDSAPIRRAAHKASTEGRLIDLTYGHACHWVLFLDSGHLALATEPVPESFKAVIEEMAYPAHK